jgi:enoyl-CoA hydratase
MTVSYEREGAVAVVTIDRPEQKNAIDRETAAGLSDAIDRFEESDAAAAVLTGSAGTFSAGADLKKMDLEDGPDGWLGISRRHVEKPTIAAVEGHCIAGGLELALWCDMRVGGESATFGCFERRFGVPLVDGATQRLPRIVGLGRALDMILTGRAVDAQEAQAWGLLNRVVEDGEARNAAVELAATIAAFPQTTVRTDRAAVYEGLGVPLEQGMRVEAWHGTQALGTATTGAERFDAGEGRGGEGVPDE